MVPVLSTRVFGRVPTGGDLAIARRLRLFDFELWLDGFAPAEVRGLVPRLEALGLRVPSVHLPVRGPAGLLDVDDPDRLFRQDALDLLRRALDLTELFHPVAVVTHARGVAGDGLGRLLGEADERGLRLALENDTLPGSSPDRLARVLGRMGSVAEGHGLCVDLSRAHVDPAGFAALDPHLLWVEVSSRAGDHAHGPPDGADRALRESVEACRLPYVAYEVVPSGPPEFPAGEAQVMVLLRRVVAWHLGAGQPMYQGASPFLPLG